jgi:hypothetical protein
LASEVVSAGAGAAVSAELPHAASERVIADASNIDNTFFLIT